ncbi:putative inactive poly [ADP-ribose] polymerase SRO3 [Raphanus sativus]|nr:putative inactive poly [ADP-ribose] polymerase SRO3 [Raphanus sativus]
MAAEQVEIVDNGEIIDSLSHHTSGEYSSSTILLREDNAEHDVVKNCFLSGMGTLHAADTTIVSVRKTSTQRITTKAKLAASIVFAEAMKRKNGGDANVRYGWYSGGSKEEIERIVSYGFSSREIEKFEKDDRSHGVGIHFLHHTCSLAAAVLGEADEEGIQHLLLCRLILGKPERIISGSKQSHPSSVQYDCGVDSLENPRKYVVWSCNMNSYILPSHVVSFKSPRLRGLSRGVGGLGRARSPCVSFPVLMSVLSKSLDHPRMNVLMTSYDDFRKGKVRREQLVRKIREVIGDELLLDIIKNHRNSD